MSSSKDSQGSSIDRLIALLKDAGERRNAIQLLSEIGPKNETALVKAANRETAEVRWWVCLAMIEATNNEQADKGFCASARRVVKQIGNTFVPRLVMELRNQDSERVKRASYALTLIGLGAAPSLIELFEDDTEAEYVREFAACTLGNIARLEEGDSPNQLDLICSCLIAGLSDGGLSVCRSAHLALLRIGTNALRSILKALDQRAIPDHEASGLLKEMGPGIIPALIDVLTNEHAGVRWWVVSHFGLIGKVNEIGAEAIMALVTSLRDEDLTVRRAAARSLRSIAREAVPTLVAWVQNAETRVRKRAIVALGRIGKRAKTAIPALIAALRTKNLRERAAVGLGRIGSDAVPALAHVLQDKHSDDEVREWAAFALGEIGPGASAAIPALKRVMEQSSPPVRVEIALELWKIDREAEAPLTILIQALNDKDEEARWIANERLCCHGQDMLPALAHALANAPDKMIRRAVASVLCQIAPKDDAVVSALRNALSDEREVGRCAALALVRVGEFPISAIQILIDSVSDKGNKEGRADAVIALGAIGTKARAAIPALKEAYQDEDIAIQVHARDAMKRIDSVEARRLGIE